ncbi:hypothetical protein ACFQH7_21675 [Microbulbifer taiwanensis]
MDPGTAVALETGMAVAGEQDFFTGWPQWLQKFMGPSRHKRIVNELCRC